MNKAIRRMWLMVAGIVMVLLLTLTYVQFFAADALQANPWNNRTLYEQFGQDRGSILVDGQEIAKSVPSSDDFEHQRVYTDSPMYSNLTGYFSLVYGATGLESAMGDELSGASDDQFYDRVVSLVSGDQPKGASVELTLDAELQKAADASAMSPHHPDGVVAAADQLNADPAQPLVNRAIGGDLYAPGSTFKLIDTVAALESGKYTTDTTIPNPSELPLPDTTVTLPNYRQGGCAARSQVNLQFALEQSCNTPFAQIAMELGQDEIRKTAENFGYGQELSIPLEVTPSVFPEEMNQAQLALSSIGQYDVRTTPLQVAMTSAAIANDGVMMKPSLVKNVRSSDLSVIDEFKAEQLRRSTDAETAQTVTELMTSVVDNGIASGAAVPGVKVAGKTGTAETGEDGLNDSWFTGFAPADDPQLAVAVVVEDVDVTTGSTVTSPSARQLFEAVLNK